MEITLNELLDGKATTIKGKDFLPTAAYVEPFIERMSPITTDFRIQVKLPDQITYDKNGDLKTDNITYNRVYIQAVLPDEYMVNNISHSRVIGFVYGLDVKTPIVKIFTGGLNSACTNLCVFRPDFLQVQEIFPESPINFKAVKELLEKTDDTRVLLENLVRTDFDTSIDNVNESLGRWTRNTIHESYDNGYQNKVKLGTQVPVEAYKLLFEEKTSPYYVGINNPCNMFTVFNAFTQINTDARKKDIFNDFERNLLISNIINL